MKRIIFSALLCILSVLLFSACGVNESVTQETNKVETILTNAEKIIGEWEIVGESEETDSGEQLYEYYTSPKGSWTFNSDGTFTVTFAGVSNYIYTIENDSYIKPVDEKSGEYEGYDLKISWQGEELVLSEYWRMDHSENAPYDEKDDHDFYILRRKK